MTRFCMKQKNWAKKSSVIRDIKIPFHAHFFQHQNKSRDQN